MPVKPIKNIGEVKQNKKLWVRKDRRIASLVYLHKSAINTIPEFNRFAGMVNNDSDFRSLCSQKFAKAFFDANR